MIVTSGILTAYECLKRSLRPPSLFKGPTCKGGGQRRKREKSEGGKERKWKGGNGRDPPHENYWIRPVVMLCLCFDQVNTDGLISFGAAIIAQYTPRIIPTSIPNTSIIAPFWADVDTGRNDGSIYYRTMTGSSLHAFRLLSSQAVGATAHCRPCSLVWNV